MFRRKGKGKGGPVALLTGQDSPVSPTGLADSPDGPAVSPSLVRPFRGKPFRPAVSAVIYKVLTCQDGPCGGLTVRQSSDLQVAIQALTLRCLAEPEGFDVVSLANQIPGLVRDVLGRQVHHQQTVDAVCQALKERAG